MPMTLLLPRLPRQGPLLLRLDDDFMYMYVLCYFLFFPVS